MPIDYVPYYPHPIEGQAILNNFTRTRRLLAYRDSDKVLRRLALRYAPL
jgi:adenine-specific DNA-methyltransferase